MREWLIPTDDGMLAYLKECHGETVKSETLDPMDIPGDLFEDALVREHTHDSGELLLTALPGDHSMVIAVDAARGEA